MSRAASPSAGKRYGLARVCRVWKIPRSTVYFRREKASGRTRSSRQRRGPKGSIPDEALVKAIRRILKESPWNGEGYRKVWARLRFEGIRVSMKRVLRLMRVHGLLSQDRPIPRGHSRDHKGTLIPKGPDEIWGTDATSTLTGDGRATVFFVVDHYTAECLGIHAARRGTRFEALVPFRQALRTVFGDFREGMADGKDLRLRHDHGSPFVSEHFQKEVKFSGVTSSPAYVKEPETNGCAERFVRTLKEQLLWLRRFPTVEDLNQALQEFMETYNRFWILQRHRYLTPSEARRKALEGQEVAA